MYVWDKRYIYLYTLAYVTKFVLKSNGIKFVFAVTYHSYHLAHIRLKGYSSQKSIDFLLNSFCIKLVTIHLSACNFAIVYLYKEIKFKPNKRPAEGTSRETHRPQTATYGSKKTIKVKQPALSLSLLDDCKTRKVTEIYIIKQGPNNQ